MPGSLLGNHVRRIEDPELLTGDGTFVGNLRVDGLLHAAFVRSPFAAAEIRSIDVDEALALPGVVAVLTADDLAIRPYHPFVVLNEAVTRPPLAEGRVRFVGDPVALVVAESSAVAADGADLVDVDYEPLPSVTDMEVALGPDAPLVFDGVAANLVAGFRDADADEALADAEVVVRGRFVNQRLAVVPMECDAIVAYADPDDPDHDLTVHVGTQMPHLLHAKAAEVLGMESDRLRVITPHVGGAFGAKAGLSPEHAVVMDAARIVGRPVAWIQTRSDNLLGMPHGRGQVQYVEMGFTADGTMTGLRCRMVGDAGAYGGFGGALVVGPTRTMAHGVYRIPKVAYDVAVALTNTTPMGAFRGAGRPEAAAFLERLVDVAADELDLDPVELRRRNLLRADELPLRTSTGAAYDSGD
jgi:aerobic carbon-monoxide dehydrogenase large subunit